KSRVGVLFLSGVAFTPPPDLSLGQGGSHHGGPEVCLCDECAVGPIKATLGRWRRSGRILGSLQLRCVPSPLAIVLPDEKPFPKEGGLKVAGRNENAGAAGHRGFAIAILSDDSETALGAVHIGLGFIEPGLEFRRRLGGFRALPRTKHPVQVVLGIRADRIPVRLCARERMNIPPLTGRRVVDELASPNATGVLSVKVG